MHGSALKLILLAFLSLPASAATPGNSCTPKTVYDAGGNCVVFNEAITVTVSGAASSFAIAAATTTLGASVASLSTASIASGFSGVSASTTALMVAMNTKLSSGPIPSNFISLSTVTAAINAISGGIYMNGGSTLSAFNLTVSSTIMLNSYEPNVSSGVVAYWMRNESSRTIRSGEIVQTSSGGFISPQGVVASFALATTTVSGVFIDDTPIGSWGRMAVIGIVQVWCGATLCPKGRWAQSSANGPFLGRATAVAAPAANSAVCQFLQTTAINTRGWCLLK